MRKVVVVILTMLSVIALSAGNVVQSTDRGWEADKGLEGKNIVLWASHGLYYNADQERWTWQRAPVMTTVEDKLTLSYVLQYLEPMIENAGANVFMPRERDIQSEEIVLEELRGKNIELSLSKHKKLKTWKVSVEKSGWYWVSIFYDYNDNASDDTRFDVVHNGGVSHYKVNQTKGYGMWVYLGKHYFKTGEDSRVVMHAGTKKTGVLVAPTVRLGGGRGASGELRAWECAREWLKYCGLPYDLYSVHNGEDNYRDDIKCRALWVNWLNTRVGVDMALAFHTDAGVDTAGIVGTLGIYSSTGGDMSKNFTNGASRASCQRLAEIVTNQIISDIRRGIEPEWTSRGLTDKRYNEAAYTDVPCFLLELLSHQNLNDIRYGLDPRFKFVVCRAVYKGILRYFNGEDAVVQPLPVKDFSIKMNGKTANLSWHQRIDTLEETAKAKGYIVYCRKDEGWDNGIIVKDSTYSVEIDEGEVMSFRVVALNEGGVSMPSEVLSCGRVDGESKGIVMIADCYDRVCAPEFFYTYPYGGFAEWCDKGVGEPEVIDYIGKQLDFDVRNQWITDDESGWGHSSEENQFDILTGNSRDNIIGHGKFWLEQGYDFCSSTKDGYTADSVVWRGYKIVDLVLGRQKTTRVFNGEASYKAFPSQLTEVVNSSLNSGSDIVVSGTNYLRDIFRDSVYSVTEQKNIEKLLGVKYRGTNVVANCVFNYGTISASVENGLCDGMEAAHDSCETILRYGKNGLIGGMVYKHSNGRKVWTFGCNLTSETAAATEEINMVHYHQADKK
ncbi:MAG: hypothetical protein MJZ93_05145 [Paludibacteraceae bacterium]|nr:hypothetical protein [Paludibacteraceae bacterium]